ncbi:MAG: hypothetical protein FWH28_08870, partial [Clostridiales bacterium]|nr:hypothetical protein [Clostridiales bacterium]
ETIAPSCDEGGYDLYRCANCNEEERRNPTPALGHSWGSGTQTKAATCDEEGEQTFTCSVCGETKTEVIEKLAHDWLAVETIAPTYTAEGYTIYRCQLCGAEKFDDFTPKKTTSAYPVIFYALDGITIVHQQYVFDGGFIDGANHELYNSWSNEGGMMAINYKLPAAWEAIPYMLEDLDTGEWFNWKTKPITKPTNVTLAVFKYFTVTFYALDGTTFVCSQDVQGGSYINGGDTALYNSWSSADALYLNYQLTDDLKARADWLKDLDTGDEFNWKETLANGDLNVTIALEN